MIQATLRKVTLPAALSFAGVCAQAQNVTIGLAADITSMDPHYHLVTSNQNVVEHVFNRLVERNEQLRMMPGLALPWRAVDPLTWEFKPRPDVKFHDGSPFTAEDVAVAIDLAAQPSAMFFPGQAKHSYSLSMSGWSPGTFEASSPLRAVLSAEDKTGGMGTVNAGKHHNPKMEEVLEKALSTLEDAARDKLLAQATEMVMADQGIVPIHHPVNLWAARKSVQFGGRSDARTYAFDGTVQP